MRWNSLLIALLVLLCDSLWSTERAFLGSSGVGEGHTSVSVSVSVSSRSRSRGTLLASAAGSESSTSKGKDQGKKGEAKAQSIFEGMLGQTLYAWAADVDSEGKTHPFIYEASTSELLQGKQAVGLYFSASWCGPCQKFTPMLQSFYEKVREQHGEDSLELVWISRDQRAEDFVAYFQKMPWLAVTMENMDQVAQMLAPRYQVQGIPHLVILDGEDATVYTLDGRGKVMEDPYGLQFPYRARSLWRTVAPRSLQRLVRNSISDVQQRVKSMLRRIVPKFLWKLLKLR